MDVVVRGALGSMSYIDITDLETNKTTSSVTLTITPEQYSLVLTLVVMSVFFPVYDDGLPAAHADIDATRETIDEIISLMLSAYN